MAETDSLTKSLEDSLARVTDWLKFAEAKNAAMIAFCSALFATASGRYWDPNFLAIGPALVVLMSGAFWGLLISLISFLPILEGTFTRLSVGQQDKAPNLIYFGDIARLGPEQLINGLSSKYHLKSGAQDSDLAQQVVNVSRIAVRKFWLFRIAAMPLLPALILFAALAGAQQ